MTNPRECYTHLPVTYCTAGPSRIAKTQGWVSAFSIINSHLSYFSKPFDNLQTASACFAPNIFLKILPYCTYSSFLHFGLKRLISHAIVNYSTQYKIQIKYPGVKLNLTVEFFRVYFYVSYESLKK